MIKRLELKIASRNTKFPVVKLTCSKDSSNFFRGLFSDDLEIYESFYIATVNNAMEIVGYAKISQGGTTSTIMDIKIVAKLAIDTMASGIMICHNHPSGNLRPSRNDLEITRKAKEVLSLFKIEVLDHLILTANSYYSFADEGEI